MKRKQLWLAGIAALILTACSSSTEGEPTESATVETSTEMVTATSTEAETETETETVGIEVDGNLKEMFAKHDMKTGTCLTTKMINDPKLEGFIKSQFNSITMENSMKPENILNLEKSRQSGELTVAFKADALQMLAWAKNNNMAVRGHTLVWYSQTPEWIFHEGFDVSKPMVDRDTMLARMESMIRQTFEKLTDAGYIDMFYAFDVVNEAIMENGKYRDNHWLEIIGEDYLWYAFYYADKYAPESVDLYYNDYNEQYKSSAIEKFVKTLVDEDGNYLIDGIGFQAHLYTGDDMNAYFKTLDQLAKTGLKIQLTELDVCLGTWQKQEPATDENLKKQGEYYKNLVGGILERVDAGTLKTDALTFWGFADSLSWRKEASPLLLDLKLEPKPAFYGVLQK